MTKTFQQLIFAALLTVAFGLAGCGGGGGPSPSPSRSVKDLGEVCGVGAAPGTVAYSTLWGPAPDQASQVLQLVDADNAVVRSVAINRQGEANTSHTMTSVTPGVYEFRATLYSQVNGQGSLFAQTSQVVDLCDTEDNTFTVQSVYGSDPTSLTVNPSELAVKEQQSRRFVASPRNTRGEVVFVSPDSVEFSVLGGLGDLTDEGVFTAVNAGTGAVRATHVPTGVNGAAAVEVEIFEIVRGKWTVMVYMNAANDLHPFSTLNMNQLEQVAQNDDVRFVVQWKQSREAWPNSSFDGVRRYLIRPNDTNDIVSDVVQSNLVNDQGQALDMGDPQTLNDFVTWAKTFYPADRFALVIWNHGNGWRRALSENQPVRAFSYDDQYLSSIKTWEMDEAFGSHQFDIIAWDASLMQMLEVAYQARSYADYIVGSEESPPGEGYPYHLVFDNFRDNPDAATETLAQAFVDGMLEFDLYDLRKITQSVVKTALAWS
ncbi:MAG: clostripain-related cysteine peptidase, partial [Fimbriimonadaceae bacterium]